MPQRPINSSFMAHLVGNCLSFLQFLAKINLLKPQKTYIYRFLPNLPAAILFWIAIICRQIAIAMNWIDVICCRPQLPVPAFQTRLCLNNTDILARPKSSPDIKKASKAVSSHHFRSLTPKYRISIIKFLLWQSKKLWDNKSSQSQYPHSSQPFILLWLHYE